MFVCPVVRSRLVFVCLVVVLVFSCAYVFACFLSVAWLVGLVV